MADLMKEILGDMLHDDTRNDDRTHLPCPDDLKRQILVKVITLPGLSTLIGYNFWLECRILILIRYSEISD